MQWYTHSLPLARKDEKKLQRHCALHIPEGAGGAFGEKKRKKRGCEGRRSRRLQRGGGAPLVSHHAQRARGAGAAARKRGRGALRAPLSCPYPLPLSLCSRFPFVPTPTRSLRPLTFASGGRENEAARMEVYGNVSTLNMEGVLSQNVQASDYMRQLRNVETFDELVDEVYNEGE